VHIFVVVKQDNKRNRRIRIHKDQNFFILAPLRRLTVHTALAYASQMWIKL